MSLHSRQVRSPVREVRSQDAHAAVDGYDYLLMQLLRFDDRNFPAVRGGQKSEPIVWEHGPTAVKCLAVTTLKKVRGQHEDGEYGKRQEAIEKGVGQVEQT